MYFRNRLTGKFSFVENEELSTFSARQVQLTRSNSTWILIRSLAKIYPRFTGREGEGAGIEFSLSELKFRCPPCSAAGLILLQQLSLVGHHVYKFLNFCRAGFTSLLLAANFPGN